MAITAFAVLLATSLDALAFPAAAGDENAGEPAGEGGENEQDFVPVPGMGDRIDQLFASLAWGADGNETEIALLDAGAAAEPGEAEGAITGPLDLSSALAHSIGVSDPSQPVGPIRVAFDAASAGGSLPPVIAGGPAGADDKDAPIQPGGDDVSGDDDPADDNDGGDQDGGGDGDPDDDGGDGDGPGDDGGDGDDPDGDGDPDDGGGARPLVKVTDGGEITSYRLDPDKGTASIVDEQGVETPLPATLAAKLLALHQKTGRTTFDASELNDGLVIDTDVSGGGGSGGGGDSPSGTLIRVTDGGETTVYRLETESGKVFVQTETGELELPGELAAILANLHRTTGRTDFTAGELDAGLDGDDSDEVSVDDGDNPESGGAGDEQDEGSDPGDGVPAGTIIKVGDAEGFTYYRLEHATGKAFVQTESGELELPQELAAILSGLHGSTGRTEFTVAELDSGFGGNGDDADESGDEEAGDPSDGSQGNNPTGDGGQSGEPAEHDETDGVEAPWFHVRVHDGETTEVFWFDRETGTGHIDDGADGIPDAALDPMFSLLIVELVEETGRTDFDASELLPDSLVVDNAIGGGGSGDFDLI